jgi:hypothetical protein
MRLSNCNHRTADGARKVLRQVKAQAKSMYAVVSSESAHVTMTPMMPTGMADRTAEAIAVIVSDQE